jgi:hypothetical protein
MRRYSSSSRAGRGHYLGLAHPADQLIGRLVKAPDRRRHIVGFSIQLQDSFHMPDECSPHGRQTSVLPLPGLQHIVSSVRRIVPSEMASTSRSSTSVSVSNCRVLYVWPLGGVLQARAMRNAVCWPSSLGIAQGRGRSRKAAARPPSTTRVQIRTTTERPTWKAVAITSCVTPASACKSRWARVGGRAAGRPFLAKVHNWVRSASVQVTPDRCVPIDPSSWCSTPIETGPSYHNSAW